MNIRNRKIEKKIKSAGKEVSLTRAEKLEIREKLISLISDDDFPAGTRRIRFSRVFFVRLAPVLVLCLFLSGTAVSYAAQGALPGDNLYGVKIMTEKAGLLFAADRASFVIRLAERRLEEAGSLEKQNRLSEEKAKLIEEKFIAHNAYLNDAYPDSKKEFSLIVNENASVIESLIKIKKNKELVKIIDDAKAEIGMDNLEEPSELPKESRDIGPESEGEKVNEKEMLELESSDPKNRQNKNNAESFSPANISSAIKDEKEEKNKKDELMEDFMVIVTEEPANTGGVSSSLFIPPEKIKETQIDDESNKKEFPLPSVINSDIDPGRNLPPLDNAGDAAEPVSKAEPGGGSIDRGPAAGPDSGDNFRGSSNAGHVAGIRKAGEKEIFETSDDKKEDKKNK